MKNKKVLLIIIPIIIILIVIACIVIFITNRNNSDTVANNQSLVNGQNGNQPNFTNIKGIVFSFDNINTAIVNADNNQGQRIVLISSNTNINKTIEGNNSDVLKVDQSILINGNLDTLSNTIKANSVTLVNITNRQGQARSGSSNSNGRNFQRQQNLQDKNSFVGKITQTSDTSTTIQTFNGTTYLVSHDITTKFLKQAKADLSDIKAGINLQVSGNVDSTGTIMARNIMILNS